MHTDEKIFGDVVVVRLSGELLDDTAGGIIEEKFTSLLTDGVKKVILDLRKVRRINSRGLSALISVVNRMKKCGGEIRFAEIGSSLNSIFIETRLVRIFRTYETVGRALASYRNEMMTSSSPAFL